MGNSAEDLEFIEDNPFFQLRSYEYTNDPTVIARHQQDARHQRGADGGPERTDRVYAIGPTVYSGTGGQLAFHLGAFLSKQGRAVTVLPSSAKSGSISTIVPQFEGDASSRFPASWRTPSSPSTAGAPAGKRSASAPRS